MATSSRHLSLVDILVSRPNLLLIQVRVTVAQAEALLNTEYYRIEHSSGFNLHIYPLFSILAMTL